jgi:mRNA-degrading endonuclease toxin of MazEF toxin-antitoxin module
MPDQLMRKLDDVLCLFISSSMPAKSLSTDFVLEPNHPSFQKTGLKYRSVFRTHKLLHKSIVLRVLGEMDKDLMNEVDQRLHVALGL